MSPARVTAGGLPISRIKPGPAHGQHASWPADHLCFTRLTGCPPGVFKPCPWSRQCSLGRCSLVEWLRTLRPREGKGYSQGHTARLVPLPLQKPRELARPGQRPPPTVNPCFPRVPAPHLWSLEPPGQALQGAEMLWGGPGQCWCKRLTGAGPRHTPRPRGHPGFWGRAAAGAS